MMRALLNTAVAAAGFVAGHMALALLILTFMYANHARFFGGAAPSLAGYANSLILTATQGILCAAAFVAITLCSRHWRQYDLRTIVWVSASGGAVALAVTWSGIPFRALVPLGAAFGAVAAVWIATALPGIVTGVVALVWALDSKPPTGAGRDP